MLDFSELSADGQGLELLVRELLLRRGFAVHWSGKGADGGRDLVCVERRGSYFVSDEKRWLIQCKHNAVSGKAVSAQDLDNIVDSCTQHGCTGFLLVCSTYPSSGAVNRLEGVTSAASNPIVTTYWDAVKLEQMLSTPRNWPIAQRFFPKSAAVEGWQIYGTERPNHWVVSYKGYYFHLTNRIGSSHEHHLESIRNRVADIESIPLPKDHFIRIRSVYYDDKNGGYTWYLDYMYPNQVRPVMGTAQIAYELGEGYALEDGQLYHFDVRQRSYLKYSDHYDPDHYDYYVGDVQAFLSGADRDMELNDYSEAAFSEEELREQIEKETSRGFDRVVAAFNSIHFIRVVRKRNARLEDLTKFNLRRSWSDLIANIDLQTTDQFFSAWFLIEASDPERFLEFATCFPQDAFKQFRLTKAYVFVPRDTGTGSTNASAEDEHLFELRLSIQPSQVSDLVTGRSLLNDFFVAFAEAIEAYQQRVAIPAPIS
jgi:hypothetical protein